MTNEIKAPDKVNIEWKLARDLKPKNDNLLIALGRTVLAQQSLEAELDSLMAQLADIHQRNMDLKNELNRRSADLDDTHNKLAAERKTNEKGRLSFLAELKEMNVLVKRIDYRVNRTPHWDGKYRLTSFIQAELQAIKDRAAGDLKE